MEENEFDLPNVQQVLNDYCAKVIEIYRRNLTQSDRIASRQLYDNVSTSIKSQGTTITVNLNVADYMRYIEDGRSSGRFPPIVKIRKWIDDKGIVPRMDSNGRLPTLDSLAFLIGRKIANEGFKGSDDLKKTLEEINAEYIDLLNQALKRDFEEYYSVKIMDKINSMIKI